MFKKLLNQVVVVVSLGISSAYAQTVNDLVILTESYPPFNYEQNGKLQGVAVDLMGLILKKVSATISTKEIKLVPWSRGYIDVQNVKNTCLFSMLKTSEREPLFKWVGPIITSKNVLIAKKDKHISIKSVSDLKKYKIGVVIDDVGEQLLVKEGFKREELDRISGTTAITQSIQKLTSGRIDILSYAEMVAMWEIKNLKLNPDDYETVYVLSEGQLYYAFNKETPDVLLEKLQGALDEISKGEELKNITKTYVK